MIKGRMDGRGGMSMDIKKEKKKKERWEKKKDGLNNLTHAR